MALIFAVGAPLTANVFPWPADPIRLLLMEVGLWLLASIAVTQLILIGIRITRRK